MKPLSQLSAIIIIDGQMQIRLLSSPPQVNKYKYWWVRTKNPVSRVSHYNTTSVIRLTFVSDSCRRSYFTDTNIRGK